MRPVVVLVLALVAGGCRFGEEGTRLPPPPAVRVGPRTFGCEPVERAVVGSWLRDTTALELREDGVIVRNGTEGAFRFVEPGHVVMDVAGEHDEAWVALTDVSEMVLAPEDGRTAQIFARSSAPPPIPEDCFDIHEEIADAWRTLDGTRHDLRRDGNYVSDETTGTWSMPARGHLTLRTSSGISDWYAALAAPTRLVVLTRRAEGGRATVWERVAP